ncbi:MAG: universal stress protein [Nocardioidaceae bacterium]
MVQEPMVRPVVVGVDGSAAALRACEYAGEVAAELGCGLRLIHAFRPLVEATADESFGAAAMKNDGYRILREAAQYLRRHTDAPIGVVLSEGRPSGVLAEASHGASVVVVGRRALPDDDEPQPSSLVMGLVPAAACPVVVVPPDGSPPETTAIVVGIAESQHSHEALRFAFAEAARHKTGVTLVRAWPIHGPEGHGPWFLRDQEANEILDEAVADLVTAYPDVPVERVVESGWPVDALLRHATDAALLVVGNAAHDDPDAVGGVTRQLVARSQVPVAVVRHHAHHEQATAAKSAVGGRSAAAGGS